jgi:hypothetical protein
LIATQLLLNPQLLLLKQNRQQKIKQKIQQKIQQKCKQKLANALCSIRDQSGELKRMLEK